MPAGKRHADDGQQRLAGAALQLPPDDARGLRQPAPDADALGQRVPVTLGRGRAHGLGHRLVCRGINRIPRARQGGQQADADADQHHLRIDGKVQHGQAEVVLVNPRQMHAQPRA